MSPTENYATILAVCSILIEKDITTREILEGKIGSIRELLISYNRIMLSDAESQEIESKKMSEVTNIIEKMANICKFNFDQQDVKINQELRNNILAEKERIKNVSDQNK